MSRFGYSKRHLYKDAVRRRLFLLRRALARGGTTIDKRATASVYWVGDADSDWYNSANWASSTGGVGGAGTGGIPTAATTVTFTGEHSNGCVLGAPVSCGAFVFDTSQGTPVDGFDMAGHTLNCTTFAYNTSDDITVILDGEIRLTGATFTVVAMHATAEAAWTGTIVLEENCTFASTPGVPATTAEKNFTTTAAVGMARLTGGGSSSTFTFFHGVDFTLLAYNSGDWDELTAIVSDDASTWGFVNPAAMVVSDIVDVQDSNATNEVDATDGCGDGTGNTNWTFA